MPQSRKLASQPGLPRHPMHASSHRTRSSMAAAQRCIASGAALEVAYALVGMAQSRQIDQGPNESDETHQDPFAAVRSLSRYTRCNATKRPSTFPSPPGFAKSGVPRFLRCLDLATSRPQDEATASDWCRTRACAIATLKRFWRQFLGWPTAGQPAWSP
jgi:hypothetical protein